MFLTILAVIFLAYLGLNGIGEYWVIKNSYDKK